MATYRKRPIEVEAFKWNGLFESDIPAWFLDIMKSKTQVAKYGEIITIKTLEGNMTAQNGDYIIKGIKGEIYPCKPDIFEASYEEV